MHLPNMCYNVKFDSYAIKDVRMNRREPPKLGSAGTRPLEVGAWLTPKQAPPHTCYHVKFGSSATKGVRINSKEPPKLGSVRTLPLGWGRG